MITIIKNCHLIDGVSPTAIPDAIVVLEDKKIADVITGGGARIPHGLHADQIIDARESWLLPGLWDVHVHLNYTAERPPDLPSRTIQYGFTAAEGLREAGVTSIRTAGDDHWIDVAWKHAFASGRFLGPRVFAAGHFLTTSGGHFADDPATLACDGPEAFARAVREQIKHGVDHIKLGLSGGIVGPSWDRHWCSFLLPEELEAAFEIARQRGFKVMSHATNPQAVKDAIRLGTWSIEHGYLLDDECIQMMLRHKTFYVPTLSISHLTPSRVSNKWEEAWVERLKASPSVIERAEEAYEEHKKWFQTALKAGVKMAVGSDNYVGPIKEATLLELELWVRDGATPMEAIMAATSIAAETCGVADQVGTIQPNKLADLILVRDSPLEDINNLRSLEMVFKEGRLVENKRGAHA